MIAGPPPILGTPERIGGAVLVVIATLFTIYNGVPWATKDTLAREVTVLSDRILQVHGEVATLTGRFERADEADVRREIHIQQLESRLSALEAYTYPARSRRPTP